MEKVEPPRVNMALNGPTKAGSSGPDIYSESSRSILKTPSLQRFRGFSFVTGLRLSKNILPMRSLWVTIDSKNEQEKIGNDSQEAIHLAVAVMAGVPVG
jgi:hypothetical protein